MKEVSNELADILIAGLIKGATAKGKLPLPEAQLCKLAEVKDRYIKGNTYKVGDIITPRAGSIYVGRGNPHMVVEVAEVPIRNFGGESSNCDFGSLLDIRVISMKLGETVAAHWMESFQMEPWEAPKDTTFN